MRTLLPAAPPGQTWIGDDAAVLGSGLLLATDAVVDGVHFDRRWATPANVGWRAMAVNLSDLAAMAGTPRAAVIAVAVPPDEPGLALGVAEGAAEAAETFACPIVGGDTTTSGVLTVTVAVLGDGRGGGPVLRSGARPAHAVFVTGPLGGSARALAALARGDDLPASLLQCLRRPRPRLAEGWAAAAAGASAMIDVSDGLARDLGHLCRESGVGVRVHAAAVPLAEGASFDEALGGGDDYELCFTTRADEDAVRESFARRGLTPPVRIGEVTVASGRVLVAADGSESALPDVGWEHPVP